MMKERIIVPRIVFDASWIYNYIWEKVCDITLPGEHYPSEKEISACTEKMEVFWNQRKKGILEELALVSNLRWRRSEITCFVVGARKLISFSAFAHPLTMRIQDYLKSPDRFLGLLIHELIHNLQTDNWDTYGKGWIGDYLNHKYPDEADFTQNHVLVYALYIHVHNKFIDKEIDKVHIGKDPDYVKAWEIVKTEGYKNIIQDFVKHVEEKKRSNL